MNTNQLKATVSECGGKAKPINPNLEFKGTGQRLQISKINYDWVKFDDAHPELPLTTPMPPNSTIMVESDAVWQTHVADTCEWFDLPNNANMSIKLFPKLYRQAYRPITADQKSDRREPKAATDNTIHYSEVNIFDGVYLDFDNGPVYLLQESNGNIILCASDNGYRGEYDSLKKILEIHKNAKYAKTLNGKRIIL